MFFRQASTIKAVMGDFFESLFPKQSQFELSYEYRNRFTRMQELRQWKRKHDRHVFMLNLMLAILLVIITLSFVWEHLCKFVRRYKYGVKRRVIRVFRSTSSTIAAGRRSLWPV